MRLIDADALIDKTDDRYSLGEIGRRERDDIVNAVEYAPTIEERKDCTTCRYNDYEWYNEPCDSCTGRHKHWRPVRETGKWIDGDKLMMMLADWWYSSFGEDETDEAKAIRAVINQVEDYIKRNQGEGEEE